MMRSKPGAIVFVICLALVLSACGSGMLKDLRDLGKLRQQLMEKFHEKDIGVHLQNSAYLTISFINSPLNDQGADQRTARAAEAAQFAARNFASARRIQGIWVAFVAGETRFIVFHYSRTLGVFAFNNRGEPMKRPEPENIAPSNDEPLSPNVRFNEARNETYISLMRIQLAGDPNHDGLALVPSFTAKGDARGPVRNAIAPDYVTLDLASYADRKLFSSDMPLAIACDRGPEFLTTAHLLVPTDAGASDKSTAQFLTAQVPFAEFAKMGESRSVRIRLGPQQYELKSEEVAALKNLAGFVSPPAAGR